MRNVIQIIAVLAVCSLVSIQSYAQIPIIPGASGFGITTPAGRGGQVFRVTNLNYDGQGSLKDCIDAVGSRVCVFETSGAINLLGGNLSIENPNITIAGQTSPSPGILLYNGSLRISTSDVLLQHIAVRVGDDGSIEKPGNADAIKIEDSGDANNIVIDHVSMSWGMDENLSAYVGVKNVTVRYSIISEALHDSFNPVGQHSKGALFGSNNGNFSMIGNLLAHNAERGPKTLTSGFVFANNVVYNYVTGATNLAIPEDNRPINHSVVGNLYIDGPDARSILPIGIRSHSTSTASNNSRVFLEANHWLDYSVNDQWQLAELNLPFSPRTDDPPVWPTGLQTVSALSDNGNAVLNLVLENAGARPADRDSVDSRVISEVRQRSGKIINCVSPDGSARCEKNAGGWPQYAQNRRALTLPSDPSGDSDGDGYTNLEEWLHQMASAVENGGDIGAMPMPPEFVSLN